MSGRVWRPIPADMEHTWEFELTIQLISQLEAMAANHDDETLQALSKLYRVGFSRAFCFLVCKSTKPSRLEKPSELLKFDHPVARRPAI